MARVITMTESRGPESDQVSWNPVLVGIMEKVYF
jgi:hypothetical protein